MASWFVSTTRAVGREEVDWQLTPHTCEEDARRHAHRALTRGFRVEAGTVPGVCPAVRIGWRTAHHWAQEANEHSIMGLRRRLAQFAV